MGSASGKTSKLHKSEVKRSLKAAKKRAKTVKRRGKRASRRLRK